ncbi:response regulator [Planctomycetota bacterium]
MAPEDQTWELEKAKDYLSNRLEEMGREKKQALAAFRFLQTLQREVENAVSVDELFAQLVSTARAELDLDCMAILDLNRRAKRLSVVASAGLAAKLEPTTVDPAVSVDDLLRSMFVSSDSVVHEPGRYIREALGYPFFVWHPAAVDEDSALILFGANRIEAQAAKQPFGELTIEVFGAIASAMQLRMDNIAKTQELLRRKDDRIVFLADILQNAPLSVIATDPGGSITHVNRAATALLGYEESELLGRNPGMLNAQPDADVVQAEILDTLRAGRVWRGELVDHKKSGEILPIRASIFPLLGRDGNIVAFVGFQEDLTEQKRAEHDKARLEEQLRHSQKMDAIGKLAGGVSHDMNNVLTVIMGLASAIHAELEPESPLAIDVEGMLEACGKGRELTRNLLGFAQKGRYRRQPISLNQAILEVEHILRRTIPRRIALDTRLDPQLAGIVGDPGQVGHVLLNVALNAAYALHGRGTLTFATRNVVLDRTELRAHPQLEPGAYVRVDVSDTGAGMDPETIEHAFEPFFTTKPRGEGTGLGLSMVYGSVRSHGGTVAIESEPDKGTTVTIHLPAAGAGEPQASSAGAPPRRLQQVTGTVLLVEDEVLVARSCERQLRGLGCSVVHAENGKAALEIYGRQRDEIALVILDLIMPVMDGAETFHRLKEMDPDVRVLLCTGYSRSHVADELLTQGAVGFLQKPFDLHQLSQELVKALPEDE